ncbi:MAG: YmdB family metallophosphoesterase, partial [Erysipelotrichales bacterium]|nr:YmdB family metallophosphoesterase [Erysipelotrichales bacterium]
DVLDELLPKCKEKIHIIDFHGEATGEKMAFAWNFDGKVSAILGTHTHVQTIDNRILPNGTAYISDVGMTGPYDGIIGAKKEEIIFKTRTGLPAKFDVETGRGQLNAVVLDIDNETGKALSIKRVYISPDYVEGI